ncbi:hypothetical protein [Rhodococcus qingshengii]|uniref:hypothetical protein n=1 Tax=Rhodococcus qingshengii TaxID=334542 RepID=UPI001C22057A|nr:hypothetical protein [Rhodococcus qingshengii]QXC46913.1 hypothetical protein KSE96_33195 [Rhodococcus qingshengii]
MTRTTTATLAAVMTIAVLVLAGCGRSDDHDHPMDEGGPTQSLTVPADPTLPEPFSSVDQSDPEAVMVAAAQALFSYTPGADTNQIDAANRAAPLLDERYYTDNASSFIALAPITGRQWESWRERSAVATATATVTADNHPEDKPAKVSRVVAVTVTAVDAGGREIDRVPFAAYMTATKLGVWRVSAVMVR